MNSTEINIMNKCLMLLFLSLLMVNGVYDDTDEVKSVSVMEGESVTLQSRFGKQKDDLIVWSYGPNDTLVARYTGKSNGSMKGFKDRVMPDDQTGDLNITNITTQHTGLYTLKISRNQTHLKKKFSVTVYARLPVPDISRYSTQCSSLFSSISNCSLLCSVLNVRDVSLSWYKGNSLLSSISVSNLKTTASLHLKVDYQDNNTYSCVLNNTITNQTQHLNITQLCQTCLVYFLEFPLAKFIMIQVGLAVICVIIAVFYKHKREKSKAKQVFTSTQKPLINKQMELEQMGEEKYGVSGV